MAKKYKLRINHFAQEDIQQTIDFNDITQSGLGEEFWLELKQKLLVIEQNPKQFPEITDFIKKAVLKRFPFNVFFVEKDNIINVFAVIHFSRSSKVWENRNTED